MSEFLRTRYRALHQRFGTAGVILGVIALILALGGTALAAKGAFTHKQKKEIEKIAKKFQGTGPAGAPGAPGAPGKDGTNGTNGTNGAPGAPGAAGTDGKNVVVSAEAPECSEGGASVEVEGDATTKQEVCNGEEGSEGAKGDKGDPGPEGSPWTDGGTLPPGATETGSWAFNGTEADIYGMWAPISFPILLAAAIEPAHVHYGVGHSEDQTNGTFSSAGVCPGGIGTPKALPGELCIYEGPEVFHAKYVKTVKFIEATEGATEAGATLIFEATAPPAAVGAGSFAVTGCTTEVGKPYQCP